MDSGGRRHTGPQRTLGVDATYALEHSIGHYRDGMVAYHAIIVLPPQRPYRQITVRVKVGKHAVYKGRIHLGGNDGVKRMGRPERIPQRECCVILLPVGHLLRRIVGRSVFAVDVADNVWLNHRVVQGSIKLLHLCAVALHLDAPQHAIPHRVGPAYKAVEIPSGRLVRHVGTRIGQACGRKPYLYHDTVGPVRVEIHPCLKVVAIGHGSLPVVTVGREQRARCHGPRQLDVEIHPAQLCPARHDTVTLHGLRPGDTQLRLYDAPVPTAFGRRVVEVYI